MMQASVKTDRVLVRGDPLQTREADPLKVRHQSGNEEFSVMPENFRSRDGQSPDEMPVVVHAEIKGIGRVINTSLRLHVVALRAEKIELAGIQLDDERAFR